MSAMLTAMHAIGLSPEAQAQPAAGYPSKSLRFVVPVGPGGSVDLAARTVGQRLSERLGRQVVIDNRPGASQVIGAEIVARSPPDGYTLMMVATAFTVSPSMSARLPYDPLRDFAPVSFVSYAPNVLVVHPSLPARNVRELIAIAKARPGQIAYASSGVGGSPHLAAELFRMVAGIDIIHVPYKGTGQSLSDLLAGQVQMSFGSVLALLPQLKAGKIRPLAVTSRARAPSLPDVPTMAESGWPGVEITAWNGVVVPAGTPSAITGRLNEEIVSILAMPDVRERLLADGAEAKGSTREEFGDYLRNEIAKWTRVVKQAGIRAE